MQLIDELNAKYGRQQGRIVRVSAPPSHLQHAAGRVDGMGAQARQAARPEQAAVPETFDAFPIKAGRLEVLRTFAIILTLDSDTQLPHGTAARLTGRWPIRSIRR